MKQTFTQQNTFNFSSKNNEPIPQFNWIKKFDSIICSSEVAGSDQNVNKSLQRVSSLHKNMGQFPNDEIPCAPIKDKIFITTFRIKFSAYLKENPFHSNFI